MATATSTSTKALAVRRLSGSLGAEIRGIRLVEATAADADAIRSLLTEHLVLFFPDQHLTPDEHIAFGRLFGELEAHPNLGIDAERPEFFELHAYGGQGAVADEWHSDLSCQASPSLIAILHMVKCPDVGGDTLWTNTYKAYDELSAPMRDLCDGLSALHDAHSHGKPEQMAVHPVVRIHPETGRKALFVNEHFTRRIVELSHQESEVILGYLTRWVASPRFTVRYHWTQGTIAMWDNRCTQHHVLNDFEGDRIIQRVTVMGDDPKPATPPRWKPYVKAVTAGSHRDFQLQSYLSSEAGRRRN
ncbi:MAG TPA: TauD/TfdA family dioxygenase [Candidatus Binatia bacterium]|nr:TauD/TfdA family dioxygenase [Candidatus Binatia bacterium]